MSIILVVRLGEMDWGRMGREGRSLLLKLIYCVQGYFHYVLEISMCCVKYFVSKCKYFSESRNIL